MGGREVITAFLTDDMVCMHTQANVPFKITLILFTLAVPEPSHFTISK